MSAATEDWSASGSFAGPGKDKLFERYWDADTEPRGAVIIQHGIAEHGGRYNHVAKAMNRAGLAVGTVDLRGHGRSEGQRCYVSRFDRYVDDLAAFHARMVRRYPGVPVFLVGHSMGGAVSVQYALTRSPDLAGLILSGPAIRISPDVSPVLIRFAGIGSLLFPKIPVSKLDLNQISRDPLVVQTYTNDPLCYLGKIPARTGGEIVAISRLFEKTMDRLSLPLLIQQGQEDRLVDPKGSDALYENAASADKTLKRYDGLRHEIFNEPEKEDVIRDTVDWIAARL